MKSLKAFFAAYSAKFPQHQSRKAYILLVVQATLLALLCAINVFVCVVQTDTMVFYLTLISGLALVNVAALVLNLSGRYTPSAWLTMITAVVGPWCSLLLDSHVAGGDYMPIVYIAVSIQLCAILLSVRATGFIAGIQLAGLTLFLIFTPALHRINWPSLAVFVVFMAALGSISSYISRRQVEQIERQRNRLLDNEAQLKELSVRDSLTGLYNRRYMEERLAKEIARSLRDGHSLGVVMVDVDEFKSINDTYGHAPGDQVLGEVAEVLRTGIRKTDFACRFGGDEFVLILPDCPLKDCVARAEAICAKVEAMPFMFDELEIGNVSLSLGVAALPEHGVTAEALMKAADDAMYAAKSKGKNCVCTASLAK